MFDFLKSKEQFTGAILSPESVIREMVHFEETVAKANPVNLLPLDIKKLPNYEVRDQDGSSGCVMFTIVLIGGILYFIREGEFIKFSPKYLYANRPNKPNEGTVAIEGFRLAAKGMLLDDLMPSDGLSEVQMNDAKDRDYLKKSAEVFALEDEWLILPVKDIQTLISVMQTTGKPIMVWYEFGSGEWDKTPRIKANKAPYRHSVTFIPPSKEGEMTYGIYEGEPAIVIQDSWSIKSGINGKRIIKESFHNARNCFAAYPRKFKFDIADRPTWDGKTIVSLQKCLQSDGYFPLAVDFVENLGPLTKQSLIKFQKQYEIPATGLLDQKTINQLKITYK